MLNFNHTINVEKENYPPSTDKTSTSPKDLSPIEKVSCDLYKQALESQKKEALLSIPNVKIETPKFTVPNVVKPTVIKVNKKLSLSEELVSAIKNKDSQTFFINFTKLCVCTLNFEKLKNELAPAFSQLDMEMFQDLICTKFNFEKMDANLLLFISTFINEKQLTNQELEKIESLIIELKNDQICTLINQIQKDDIKIRFAKNCLFISIFTEKNIKSISANLLKVNLSGCWYAFMLELMDEDLYAEAMNCKQHIKDPYWIKQSSILTSFYEEYKKSEMDNVDYEKFKEIITILNTDPLKIDSSNQNIKKDDLLDAIRLEIDRCILNVVGDLKLQKVSIVDCENLLTQFHYDLKKYLSILFPIHLVGKILGEDKKILQGPDLKREIILSAKQFTTFPQRNLPVSDK